MDQGGSIIYELEQMARIKCNTVVYTILCCHTFYFLAYDLFELYEEKYMAQMLWNARTLTIFIFLFFYFSFIFLFFWMMKKAHDTAVT